MKTLYYDFDANRRIDSRGVAQTGAAQIAYQDVATWLIAVRHNASGTLSAVDLSAVTAWRAAVDIDFDKDKEPCCRTLDANIDSSGAAAGDIVVRLDANTAEFAAAVGTNATKGGFFELAGLNAAAEQILYLRIPTSLENTLDPSGGDPPEPVGNFYDKTEVNALVNGKADASDLAAHEADTANPHAVTKAQVGLGNADNTADMDKPVSTAQQAALDLKADASALASTESTLSAVSGALTAHEADTANPHIVTKTQVGLGNADNTADMDKPVSTAQQAALDLKANASALTTKADLEDGKVPASQLPSYVDDVLEVADYAALPATGESGKIYITTADNKQYRWSGSAYAEISASLALGETNSTAYRGDQGKTAYDHSQLTSGNPHGVTAADVGAEPADSAIQSHIASTSNPHAVTAAQVGLANVDNTADADKPVSTAQQAALDLKASAESLASTASTLSGHASDTANPHAVTAAQAGAEPANANIQTHIADTANPHAVTKAQVGLGNADNTSDLDKPISTATQSALDTKVDKAAGKSLVADTEIVRLAGMETGANNYVHPAAHAASIITQDASNRFVTDAEKTSWNGRVTQTQLEAAIDGITGETGSLSFAGITGDPTDNQNLSDALDLKANSSDLAAHIADTANPHDVTKAQVGLGNADNTSDSAKPVSTAQAAALALKADLTDGKVPASQLPSYVDDVLEVTNYAALPATGEAGKIYVTTDTNKQYRWSGSAYAEISASLTLGETSATAYRGDRGKAAYDHTANTANPHAVTKAQVGLGSVDNTADSAKPVSTAQAAADALNLKIASNLSDLNNAATARTNLGLGSAATTAATAYATAAQGTQADGAYAAAVTNATNANTANTLVKRDSSGNFSAGTITANLTGNASTATTAAGLSATLAITSGGTGATTAAAARTSLGAASTSVATTSASGLMSSTDKSKLDGIAAGANNYTHPASHTPSIIVQDASNRFVTDAEKIAWNAKAAAADLTAHEADTANPHAVTKAQVGLSAVDNTSDANKPVSTAQATAIALKADASALTAHISNVTNPHAVTKAQVGLGNADNTSDANKPVSTAQAAADALSLKIASNLSDLNNAATARTNLGLGTAATTASTAYAPAAHASSTANPHAVTKAQVGLGNVDNTADSAKPVSTAQAAALATKADILTANTTVYLGTDGKPSVALAAAAAIPITGFDNAVLDALVADGKLSAAWSLEESGTADRVDSVAARNLVVSSSGTVAQAVGKHNYCTSISSAAGDMTNSTFPSPGGKLWSFWVYLNTGSSGVSLELGQVSAGANYTTLSLNLTASLAQLSFDQYLYTPDTHDYDSDSVALTLETGQWYHVALGFEQLNAPVAALYIGGVKVLTLTSSSYSTYFTTGVKLANNNADGAKFDEFVCFDALITSSIASALHGAGFGKFYGQYLVGIPVSSHSFAAGDTIRLDGTTNYDGADHVLDASTTSTQLVFPATYVAETFDGSEFALYKQPATAAELQALINAVPKNISTRILTFQIRDGWYELSAGLKFQNFYGYALLIYGNASDNNAAINKRVVIKAPTLPILVTNNTSIMRCYYIKAVGSSTVFYLYNNATELLVRWCSAAATNASSYCYGVAYSNCDIMDSYASGGLAAVRVRGGSGYSESNRSNQADKPIYGLHAYGATIYKGDTTQFEGATQDDYETNGGHITPLPDTDATEILGRVRLGYDGVNSDVAVVTHYDAPTGGIAVNSAGGITARGNVTLAAGKKLLGATGGDVSYQILYVHPTTGNNANSGTSDAPLATIAEAVNRAFAGKTYIYLYYDQTYPVTTTLNVRSRDIAFKTADSGTTKPTIAFSGSDGIVQFTGKCAMDFQLVNVNASGVTNGSYRVFHCVLGSDVMVCCYNMALTGNDTPFVSVFAACCKLVLYTVTIDSTGTATGSAIYSASLGGMFLCNGTSNTFTGGKYAAPTYKTWL